MKKSIYALASLALLAGIVSCNKEVAPAQENTTPIDEGQTPSGSITVKVNMDISAVSPADSGPASKAALEDGAGIVWEAGDKIRFEGNTGAVEAVLAPEGISDNGHRATFSIAIPNVTGESPRGVFRYNWSLRNLAEWDFGDLNHSVTDASATLVGSTLTYTQAQAGSINKAFLFMHSGTSWDTTIEQSQSSPVEVNVAMKIVGSVFRIMPYTEAYNDESVQRVTLVAGGNKNLGGTVVYDYVNGTYRDANNVNWLANKSTVVNLGTAFSLSAANSRENSKGIYIPVPATSTALPGYTIVVKTDKAKYTFTTSEALNVSENAVKNIYLKLENGDRLGSDTIIGDLNYWGSVENIPSKTYSSDAVVNDAYGYWVASVKRTEDTGRTTMEANVPANADFYDVAFSCIDDATGQPADWCNVRYRTNDTWWLVNLTENTSPAQRSATVTATMPVNVWGYQIMDGYQTQTIHIVQQGKVEIVPAITNLSATSLPAEGGSVTATLSLTVDGNPATDEQFNNYISQVQLTCENGSVARSGNNLTVTVAVNPTTEVRNIVVKAQVKDKVSTATIAQAASAQAASVVFSYSFAGWQDAFNNDSNPRAEYYDNADADRNGWIAVLVNPVKNGVPYSAGNQMTADDKTALIKYVLQLSDSEPAALTSWLTISVDGNGMGEVKIIATHTTANTTGAARTFEGYVYNPDLASTKCKVIIRQHP